MKDIRNTEEEEYRVIVERKAKCSVGRKTEIKMISEDSEEHLFREVDAYLSDYRTSARMLEMNRYERDYFSASGRPVPDLSRETEVYLKAKMYEIRAFVLSLGDCDEKLLLYYHYIHGESFGRCAELLCVSRATVYRLRRRALRTAARSYGEKKRRAE